MSVVAGVGLAVLLSIAVGLSWWSLGLLIGLSLVVGQVLRLGDNLLEVPISAMLVLGVGAASARAAAGSGSRRPSWAPRSASCRVCSCRRRWSCPGPRVRSAVWASGWRACSTTPRTSSRRT